ncbi:methylglyoxal reductase (NADPH-dependent) gre2 [Sporothrix bragantina]|uniref:Methylglyoxal reductase (NADPH-dependent) gre2 n=1 Tax=Sporothrix bragantina TaxID=671064 RepID=A0ABP0D077_9PEZI
MSKVGEPDAPECAVTQDADCLAGGSGFIATHVLRVLLSRGYNVVTTVRSATKGDKILETYADYAKNKKLAYVIVGDIAKDGAFDEAVQSDPPFSYVIHTASPFPSSFNDPVKDVLEPAINGTTGILKAIQAHAPSVKRVVITSSFAAMTQDSTPPKIYDESSWNPITWDEALTSKTYRGSKTLAEKAAWDFVDTEKPAFDLSTICPPLVFGPVEQQLSNINSLNTSNQQILNILQGKHVHDTILLPAGSSIFTDVRDLALAHVRAIEVPEAGGKRFFVTAGHYSCKRIVDIIRASHPELASVLPKNLQEDLPADIYGYDNGRVKSTLGIEFRPLKECIDDTVASLLKLGV